MRKILFLALSICSITITAQSQITKGSIFLGGDLSISSIKREAITQTSSSDAKESNFIISPVFGVAIKENLIFGGSLMLGGAKYDYDNPGYTDADIDLYGAGLLLRKYKNLGTSGFYLFLQSDLEWIKSKQIEINPTSSSNTTTKTNNYSISLYPGLSYAINRKFHIEAGLANLIALSYTDKKYRHITPTTNNSYNEQSFGFTSSLDNGNLLTVGIRFILSKKGS